MQTTTIDTISNGNSSIHSESNVDDEESVSVADISLLQKRIRSDVVNDDSQQLNAKSRDSITALHSVVNFIDLKLKPELLEAMSSLGYHKPTKIQGSVLSTFLIKTSTNILAQSQSGTGKTAAFVISLINSIITKRHFPQALCIAPTVELANQICDRIKKMSAKLNNIQAITAVKNVSVPADEILPYQIVVGTPGTVLDWIRRLQVIDPSVIQFFILDEADVMLSMQGFIEQSAAIIKMLPKKCRIGLFSATYQKTIVEMARDLIPNLIEYTLLPKTEFMGNIFQFYSICASRQLRFNVVHAIYQTMCVGKCMIFCKTRSSSQWIGQHLRQIGANNIQVLCGDMNIDEREKAILDFIHGESRCLIATNVVARGIDIVGVNLIINYDLPMQLNINEPDYETYLHRVGRTGRLGLKGVAINLISKEELKYIDMLKERYGISIDELTNENCLLDL